MTLAAIVLAAGRSTRMAPSHKLLEPFGDSSVLGTTLTRLAASSVDAIVVVVGHDAARVAAEATRAVASARIVHAPGYADGLSATLAVGVGALPAGAAGALVVLGDMPLVRSDTIELLLSAWRSTTVREPIAVPVHEGRRGNPVLWHRAYFGALGALCGDRGGRVLLDAHPAAIVPVATIDAAVLLDIDTADALVQARALVGANP